MAELGKRQLEPDTIVLLLAIYHQMENAPAHQNILDLENEVLESFLLEAEKNTRFVELKTILKKRMDKFKEPFPERFFHLPDQEIVPIGNDAQTEILKEIARLTTRRLHRYKNVYKQKLKSELELVCCKAVEEYLRKILA